jgi:hypothetical protein
MVRYISFVQLLSVPKLTGPEACCNVCHIVQQESELYGFGEKGSVFRGGQNVTAGRFSSPVRLLLARLQEKVNVMIKTSLTDKNCLCM